MTKSVKEKDRLAKIRECKLNGIPVPSNLIKIKIFHRKHTKRAWKNVFNKERLNFLYNNSHIHTLARSYVEKHIHNFLANIANQLDIYTFKVLIVVTRVERTKELFIKLWLLNERKKDLGNLFLSTESLPEFSYSETLSPYICNYDGEENEKITIDDELCQLMIMEYNFKKYFSRFKNDKFHAIISNFMQMQNKFLLDTKTESELITTFIVEKQIGSVWKDETKQYYIQNIEEANEIDIIKMLIHFRCINLDIDEKDLKLENIEDIKDYIRLNNY